MPTECTSRDLVFQPLGPRAVIGRFDGGTISSDGGCLLLGEAERLTGALRQLAAVARLSPYHFARQFKRATGLAPHQYVILRRVEQAKHLLQVGTDLSLAEVALRAGFSDQSVFCLHFKRLVGVTPRQFRMSARRA